MSKKAEKEIVTNKTDVFDKNAFVNALTNKRNGKIKISIREASLSIGISAATLSRLENFKEPDVYTYYYCCKWLGVEMSKFFNK